MTSREIAELTGYARPTIYKYAKILGIPYTGEGFHRSYHWTDDDVERVKAAVMSADGDRDKRGKRGKSKKNEKNQKIP